MIGFVGGFNDSEKIFMFEEDDVYTVYDEFQPSPSFYRHICVCGKPFGKAQADSTSDGDNGGAKGLAEWFFRVEMDRKLFCFSYLCWRVQWVSR